MSEIAVVHVPIEEWTEVKTTLKNISSNLKALRKTGESEFLTMNEAKEMLRVSTNTLNKYIDAGELKVIQRKKHDKKYFERTELYRFLGCQNE